MNGIDPQTESDKRLTRPIHRIEADGAVCRAGALLHVACFIAKSVRFMTALDVGGTGCVRGRSTRRVTVRRAGGRGRAGETMRGPGMLQQRRRGRVWRSR